jgi:hypothetical protein
MPRLAKDSAFHHQEMPREGSHQPNTANTMLSSLKLRTGMMAVSDARIGPRMSYQVVAKFMVQKYIVYWSAAGCRSRISGARLNILQEVRTIN